MSMIGDFKRTVVAKAIKSNWTINETRVFITEMLCDLQWGNWEEEVTREEVVECARYMATQSNGVYRGLTQEEILNWIEKF